MLRFLIFFAFCACTPPAPSNAIEQLGEEVLKKKEGLDIRLMPIEEEKRGK